MHGYYFEELREGMEASLSKTITESDVGQFAGITGDFNPVHVNKEFARQTRFQDRIAHGMLTAGMISAVLGTRLPGPGAIYLSQNLRFRAPVYLGDTVTATVRVTDLDAGRSRVSVHTGCFVGGRCVLEGDAVLLVDRRGGEPNLVEPTSRAGTMPRQGNTE
ncbi:MaoC family dehydratase [Ectothiorhodospiraceae bacterium WFHF3C12]|nr:MaoC family dehydratase [Ectothiorhodospiraceae bacterium WFHF3C12]